MTIIRTIPESDAEGEVAELSASRSTGRRC